MRRLRTKEWFEEGTREDVQTKGRLKKIPCSEGLLAPKGRFKKLPMRDYGLKKGLK